RQIDSVWRTTMLPTQWCTRRNHKGQISFITLKIISSRRIIIMTILTGAMKQTAAKRNADSTYPPTHPNYPANLQSNLFGQHSSSNLLSHPLFTNMVEQDLRYQPLNNCSDSVRPNTDKN